MKSKAIVVPILAAAFSLFVFGRAIAQHDEHHTQDQTAQDQSKAGMMGQSQNMVGGGMMGMMGQMSSHHQQMFRLMEKLMASMKAIEEEKDPTALQSKLSEHRALLEQMHAQMNQEGSLMGGMSDAMKTSCSGMGASPDNGAQNVMGTVKSISATSITVETMDQTRQSVTVTVLASTKFNKDGRASSLSDLQVGDRVLVNADKNGERLETSKVTFGQLFQHMDMHH